MNSCKCGSDCNCGEDCKCGPDCQCDQTTQLNEDCKCGPDCHYDQNSQLNEDCICHDESVEHVVRCIICKKETLEQMNVLARMYKCEVHHVLPICGFPDHICGPCINEGWCSTKGTGMAPILKNRKTGEEKQY